MKLDLKIRLIFLLTLSALFFSSCSLFQRHETMPAVEEPVAQQPIDAPTQPTGLKKTINDEDLKKKTEDGELKKRVVVLPILEKKTRFSPQLLASAREAFVDALNTNAEMIALDPSVLKLDLEKYVKNNSYDLKKMSKDISTVGVNALLETRVVDVRFQNEDLSKIDNASSLKTKKAVFEVVVQARMLNIRSEQELFNTVKTVTIDDESALVSENVSSQNFFSQNSELTELLIKDALFDFNAKLVESLRLVTWEGRIAAFQGERIFLNVGQISGVQVGDILKVVEDSDEVYDSELGYNIGKVNGKVKGTLEIVGFFGQDGAISVIHSGAGFKENDRVEVYQ